MTTEDKGWPPDTTPVAERIVVTGEHLGGRKVARLEISDVTGDTRSVLVPAAVAVQLVRDLLGLVNLVVIDP